MNFPDFSRRHPGPEWLDDPAAPRAVVVQAYRDLAFINRWSGGRRALLKGIEEFAPPVPGRPWRIVDAGFGGADLWPALRGWAVQRGVAAEFIGLDLQARTDFLYPGAVTHRDLLIAGDAGRPPLRAGDANLAISTLTLHHLPNDAIPPFMQALARLGRQGALIVDLRRAFWPWLGIWLGTRLCGLGPMVRQDGPLSVRRGFSAEELHGFAATAGLQMQLRRRFPGRWVIYLGPPSNSDSTSDVM